MAHIRVTLRAEIELADGSTSVVEQSVIPTGFGDNPIFFGDVVEQASYAVRVRVVDALNAAHGTAPHAASVTVR